MPSKWNASATKEPYYTPFHPLADASRAAIHTTACQRYDTQMLTTRKCTLPSYPASLASLSSPHSLISFHSACLTCETFPPPHLNECEGMGRCAFMKITGILSNIGACWKEGGYFGEGNGVTWHTVPCEHSAHTTRPQARQ